MNRIIVLVILSLTLVVWENYAISNETNDSSYSKSNEVNIYSSRKGYLLKYQYDNLEENYKFDMIKEREELVEKDGKSMIGILSLGIAKDKPFTITLDGEDEELYLSKFEELLDNE